jgi:4-hydroxy-tetrahydrodipicolinate reductase
VNHAKPKVMVIGLGPIGLSCARAIRAERDIKLVGLVDNNPDKLGKTLDEITGKPGSGDLDEAGLRIVASMDDIRSQPDVAVLTMTSYLQTAAPMLLDLMARGVSVVSSCEEMTWPSYRHAQLARELDEKAMAAGVTLLGTGVNPGFVMDLLPVTLASMLRRVTAVRCKRQIDAALRRSSLQNKIGVTLSPAKFNELKQAGTVGHVGLAESVAMLAAGLGREVQPGSVQETLEPIIADRPLPSALGLIGEGRVAGIHQTADWEDQGLRIELELIIAAGLEDPRDVIEIDGPVQIRMKIPGSLPGDSATVAAILNAIGSTAKWTPGLKTMLDLPPSGCHNRDWEPVSAT